MKETQKPCQACGTIRKLEDLVVCKKDLSPLYRMADGRFIIDYWYCKDNPKCLKLSERFKTIKD
ncbi:MAG: hypothetical protein HQ541_23445 [Mariniphaga sp.]|nr:hypothetical protein [Mariniphaga sp.]